MYRYPGSGCLAAAGLLAAAPGAVAATATPTPAAGARKSATRLPFTISGTANLSVDVGTGNGMVTDQLLTLPGVTGSVPITLSYNTSVWGSATPSAVTGGTGSGWVITGFDQRLVSNPDGSITYYGPGGLTGVFTPNGAGGYMNPPQFPADLVPVAGGGWTLTDHGSQTKLSFTAAGRLTSTADRNGNTTTFIYTSGGFPASVVSSRGSVATRTVSIATSSGGMITSLTQTVGYSSRTVSLGYSSLGHLASVTDTVGGVTQFTGPGGADTGQVGVITNPAGQTTTLGFTGTQAGAQVNSVAQSNPAGAGTATTRLAYPSATQTLVADPTTDQSEAVGVVPHTTYNLTTDGTQLVASATDPDGHSRSASYTPLQNVASATPAAGGATTFSYGANSGESLTHRHALSELSHRKIDGRAHNPRANDATVWFNVQPAKAPAE